MAYLIARFGPGSKRVAAKGPFRIRQFLAEFEQVDLLKPAQRWP